MKTKRIGYLPIFYAHYADFLKYESAGTGRRYRWYNIMNNNEKDEGTNIPRTRKQYALGATINYQKLFKYLSGINTGRCYF